MSNKLINRSRPVQILAITAILSGLHAEQVIEIGTPGKDHLEAFKSGTRDLVAMIKSGKYSSKALRARFSQLIAQLQMAVAAIQAAQGMAPWAFSDANYNSVFQTVQALVALARQNGVSLVEQNPISKMVQNLNGTLFSSMEKNVAQGWYEQVLVATIAFLADIQTSTSSARDFCPTAISFVGFEPKTAETETQYQAETAPAAPALVAASGETIDSNETSQEDYSKVGYNATKK